MTNWLGEKECNFCHADLSDETLIDGRTCYGPWAVMCDLCHVVHGVGLGTGSGQRYEPQEVRISKGTALMPSAVTVRTIHTKVEG